jgi:hypothetical protein
MSLTPEELKIKRPIEVKCTDCGKVSVPEFQMEKNDGGNFIYSDGCITLCDECMKKGWTCDPDEMIKALNDDPLFQVGYQSPIQRHDL